MARIFITGSSDGLGSLTAQRLIKQGHSVVLHARNAQRAADAKKACPGSDAVLVADLTSIEETKGLAAEANKLGPFDAVVHNAGLFTGFEKVTGKSGLPSLFTVNVLAPYILTALVEERPKRLVYVSSGLHEGGKTRLDSLEGSLYADSKLHDIMLAKAFARRFRGVESNSVDPGWVPTKMGGSGATGDIEESIGTYVMLALGEGAAEGKTGRHFYNSQEKACQECANDEAAQDELLKRLAEMSGVELPQ
ncbi:short-chain dehydrogenase [Diaporthe helianthi]|uniref:Short-chain dehydrogenase n=1 Tax=Diaporthe helianthi TaxID=158607 RepID=A0A2P5HLV9_DIAHE|nr:short-chain dehydrogenase [Diaporthe helianthi]